jgi:hypothetical protein
LDPSSISRVATEVYAMMKDDTAASSAGPESIQPPPPSATQATHMPATIVNTVQGLLEAQRPDTLPSGLSSYVNFSAPLGALVSQKNKCKIWSNEYVDLLGLLSSKGEEKVTITFSESTDDRASAISLNQAPMNAKQIKSIEQWTSAFIVFTSIYGQKNPNEAINLCKYMQVIRDTAYKFQGFGWRTYDENFRRLRASNPLPWEQLDIQLFIFSTAPSNAMGHNANTTHSSPLKGSPGSPTSNIGSSNDFPPGFCWPFLKTGSCSYPSCARKHQCPHCLTRQWHHPTQCHTKGNVSSPAKFANRSPFKPNPTQPNNNKQQPPNTSKDK